MSHLPALPSPVRLVRQLVALLGAAVFLAGLAGTGHAQFESGTSKQVTATLLADTTTVAPGKPFTAAVRLKMLPGWHVYYQFSGESGAPPKINWTLPEGFKVGPIQWALPTAHMDVADMLTYTYDDDALFMVEVTPPATIPPGEVTLKAHVEWLVCEQICVPGQADVDLKLPVGEAAPANTEFFTQWKNRLPQSTAPPFQVKWDTSKAGEFSLRVEGVAKETKVEFFPLPPNQEVKSGQPKVSEITADGTRTITFPAEGATANLPWRGVIATGNDEAARQSWEIAAPASAAAVSSTSAPPTKGLVLVLIGAFFGGLILNVMPCVLPVIALKIFGFVHQAGQDPGRIFKLGLAFTAGVFTFFLILATAVVQLKTAFNWGYVLQNPYSLSFLVAIIFAFSLNLLGVFEISLSGGTATKLDELSRHEGLGGAFMHGLFTTLLGTSCTAPFLATSLGYATTQPAPVIYLIFVAIATGMALPYFLLTARPAWLKFVPKPGMWMERVKQFMGFVMLAVGVWLFSVLALRGAPVAGGMGWMLLVVGLACWVIGTWRESLVARLLFLGLVAAGYYLFLHGPLGETAPAGGAARVVKSGSITWEPYTEERLAEARKSNQPVFVDFTAEWCINCKVYEKAVLATDSVGAKFAEKKIVPLRADWTNTNDPVVTKALKSFGRVGVPLYVIYRPGEAEPIVADALTSGWLIGELDKIKD